MCTVSDKIILCTCEIKDVVHLKHFWCLYRENPNPEVFIIGQPVFPYESLLLKNPHNLDILCEKLNDGNIFDKPIDFLNDDRLQISIHFKGVEFPTDYGFEFQNGKWEPVEFEYFNWLRGQDEFKQGKIKNAISRKK